MTEFRLRWCREQMERYEGQMQAQRVRTSGAARFPLLTALLVFLCSVRQMQLLSQLERERALRESEQRREQTRLEEALVGCWLPPCFHAAICPAGWP